jgi:hypothetical protein
MIPIIEGKKCSITPYKPATKDNEKKSDIYIFENNRAPGDIQTPSQSLSYTYL